MKYLSLFSGIGGFELAIQRVKPKWQCIGYSEINKYAIQVYNSHFNHTNYGDTTRIDTSKLPDFDLLCGGFPCQAFSIAGKRKGFNDTKGTLFFEIARILRDKHPRYFLLENVQGLLSHDNGQTFNTILRILTDLGYRIQWQLLNSKHYGVPQNRERIFIVGYLGIKSRFKVFPISEKDRFYFETPKKEKSKNTQFASTLMARSAGGQNLNGNFIKTSDGIRRLTPIECERLQGFPDNWTIGISDSQRYKCLGNAITVNTVMRILNEI